MKSDEIRSIPVDLRGQFRRHLPRYVAGVLLLALYQTAQWWFDVRLQEAINAATSGKKQLALSIGGVLVVVALGNAQLPHEHKQFKAAGR